MSVRSCFLLILFWLPLQGFTQHSTPVHSSVLRAVYDDQYNEYLNNPDSALIRIQEVLDSARLTADNQDDGLCFYLLSKIYWVKNNYQLSLEYGFRALRLFEEFDHPRGEALSLLSVARTMLELGNTAGAHAFLQQAGEVAKAARDTALVASTFREWSYYFAETNVPDSSLLYSDQALQYYLASPDSTDVGILYDRKSRIYYALEKYQESLNYAYHSMRIAQHVGNRRLLGIAAYRAALSERALGRSETALTLLQRARIVSDSIGHIAWVVRTWEALGDLHFAEGRMKRAAIAFRHATQLKNQLYDSQKSGQIQEMQVLHNLREKEKTIAALAEENSLKEEMVSDQRLFVVFLVTIVILLALLSIALTRFGKMQNKTNQELAHKNQAIEKQKREIQVQAENLRALDEVKTKLFSVISHDLRGPLQSLQSLLDLLTRDLMTDDEFRALSGKLKENLNRTHSTLENLLAWSVSQMGGIRTQRQQVDIGTCIHEACRLLEDTAGKKNIRLEVMISETIHVSADIDQLQIILRNLVHNAIKFSPFDDLVQIEACVRGGYCHVTVRDAGIGMSPEEVTALRMPGQHLTTHGTHKEKGTGLGLWLCQEFISRNGGALSIESALGKGTEVAFTLRLAGQEEAIAAPD